MSVSATPRVLSRQQQIEQRIAGFYQPVDDIRMLGGDEHRIICMLLFTNERNSRTQMLENGAKIPIHHTLLQDAISGVLVTANSFCNQNFVLPEPHIEPKYYYP